MPVSAVIFDLGSTLVKETAFHPEEAQCFVLSHMDGSDKLRLEDLQRFNERVFQDMLERRERSGLEFQLTQYFNLLQSCLNVRLRGDLDEIGFRCWLLEHAPRLEDGVEDCLRQLRQTEAKIGLLSNTILSQRSVALALKKFGVEDYFAAVVCSSEVGYRKPHRLIFEAILSMVEVSPGESAMVGDSLEHDIAGAASLGMRTVWFKPDGVSASEIKPDHIVSDLSAIPGVLGLG
jgi:HAD superfamily hydrolase (TIGR01509 family)